MKIFLVYIFLFLSVFNFSSFAQDDGEEENPKTFFGGINIGTFFANSNAAIIYTGTGFIQEYRY